MKGRKRGNPPPVSDQFMAEVGHELGNVLNGLLGMTRLVRDSALNTEQDRWLKAIEQSGRQLGRLVEALRQGPVQADSGIRPQPLALDGVELLEQLLLAQAPAARKRADRLWLVVAPNLPRRWVADPCLLRQLLDNLLGNALKFTQSGEVVLEAGLGAVNASAADTLVLVVADSGPGIHPELGKRMFRAYERGPAPVRDGAAGCGLGLFICQRIVRALGGTVEWSTPASGGTRFTVTLPGMVPAPPARPAILPSRILQSIECRLDLQGAALRSVASCLARLGVSSSQAATGTERAAGDEAGMAPGCRDIPRIVVCIGEVPDAAAGSGPQLLLRAGTVGGGAAGSRRLDLPVLEGSLGPLLLELALERLWLRNAGPGSIP